jgi:hypothetical protein
MIWQLISVPMSDAGAVWSETFRARQVKSDSRAMWLLPISATHFTICSSGLYEDGALEP